MLSAARLSPTTRGVKDIPERIERLSAYEAWGTPTRVDFEKIVGAKAWEQHWLNWERVQIILRESQVLADSINQQVGAVHNAL